MCLYRCVGAASIHKQEPSDSTIFWNLQFVPDCLKAKPAQNFALKIVLDFLKAKPDQPKVLVPVESNV